MKSIFTGLATLMALALAGSAVAKLPALSDDAKAKAAEAAAKTAHAGKVEAYQLCKAQDKLVARTNKAAKPAAKDGKAAPAPASSCVDPGVFVYAPPPPATAASAPASAPVLAAAPAAADKPKK